MSNEGTRSFFDAQFTKAVANDTGISMKDANDLGGSSNRFKSADQNGSRILIRVSTGAQSQKTVVR